MNTLLCLGASVAILRLSVWLFQNTEPALGYGALIVFVWSLTFLLQTALQDLHEWRGPKGDN